jgi:putative ABC transport system substrate-binding protein
MKLNPTRLALLKEVLPGATRVAALGSPAHAFRREMIEILEQAARSLGVQLQVFDSHDASDLEDAFSVMTRERVDGLLVLQNPLLFRERKRVTRLALTSRLPSIYDLRQYVDAGGLMSYGPNRGRRAAAMAEDPARAGRSEAAIEQPAELVINLRTAHMLGLAVPPSVLARADEVIE